MFKILILQRWYGLSDLEVERQLEAMGLQVKRGTVQDATFIEADPGSSKKPRGENARTRRSRDGIWTKKGKESYFGYKLHQKTDIDYCLISKIETTTKVSLWQEKCCLPPSKELVLK